MSNGSRLRILTEIVAFTALSAALYSLPKYTMPMGGSITAGSMIPIFWLSLRRGPRTGIEAGLILGLVVMVIEPYLFNPLQIMLDYLVPFAALGLAGFFKKYALLGVGVGITARFISHFLSGIINADIFIFPYDPGANPVIYSALYNGSYLVPEFAISAIIMYILVKRDLLEVYM